MRKDVPGVYGMYETWSKVCFIPAMQHLPRECHLRMNCARKGSSGTLLFFSLYSKGACAAMGIW